MFADSHLYLNKKTIKADASITRYQTIIALNILSLHSSIITMLAKDSFPNVDDE